jgi:2-amino-4-hydroxy-6-hydroxymethyldihydropteridine diphosphokinase
MALVYVLLGTNLGERTLNLYQARQWIQKKLGNILRCSSIHETKAWGYDSENVYFNQALLIETTLLPDVLLQEIKSIEQNMGRAKKTKDHYEDRIIDIDILFYDDLIYDNALIPLQIPHPRFCERAFAIAPLCEIVSDEF